MWAAIFLAAIPVGRPSGAEAGTARVPRPEPAGEVIRRSCCGPAGRGDLADPAFVSPLAELNPARPTR